jgi:flagellar basal body-associated protein FliL
MLVLLLLVLIFVPAFLSKTNSDFDCKNSKVEKAIIPILLIAAAAVSLAVGIYTFLQMRKMQKKNRPKAGQIDGTIADEGVSFCDIAGSPHVHPNITDLWNKKSKAIKQKSGGFLGIGKQTQVTGYRYYTSFAAFIGNRIEVYCD